MWWILAIPVAASDASSSAALNTDAVTPGPIGFAVFLILLAVVVGLGWDLVRRIRRLRYREEIARRLDEEELEKVFDESDTHDGGSSTGSAG